ncbi:hypothetical protein [Sessilibacter corallicola]|uniref:Uncharacterized protein n=1 Tax=Sessilibacter corallicola TaxID=2904075 RepID=A0ABQ0A4P6_9GAMM
MLYTLIHDSNNYLEVHFNREQIWRILEEYGDDHIDHRIDVNCEPKSFQYIIKEPLSLSFPIIQKSDKNKKIPDIHISSGRLFMNTKAFQVLKPLIESDGEFLPVTYENGEGYFYIPFRIAEDRDAINTELSTENSWNYFDHLVFYEKKIEDWSLFRMKYDGYKSVFCQESVKAAIENAGLKGLFITNDLANIFPEERSTVSKLN